MDTSTPYELVREFVVRRRRELGLNQYELAAAAGVSKGLISMLEAGRSPNIPKPSSLSLLATGLKADPEVLMQLSQGRSDLFVMADDTGLLRLIPPGVPDHILALGWPIFGEAPQAPSVKDAPGAERSVEEGEDYVELPYFGEVGAGNFLLLADYPLEFRKVPRDLARGDGVVSARGDSMTLAGIHPGMNLVVRRQDHAEPGQIVLASVPYQGTVVKRFEMLSDGPYLMSNSQTYHPPIKMDEEVRITGLVRHAWIHVNFS